MQCKFHGRCADTIRIRPLGFGDAGRELALSVHAYEFNAVLPLTATPRFSAGSIFQVDGGFP